MDGVTDLGTITVWGSNLDRISMIVLIIMIMLMKILI